MTSSNSSSADRTSVAAIYGGVSPEYNVSYVSAGATMDHLDEDRFRVVPIGITKDGVWIVGTCGMDTLCTQGRTMLEVIPGEEVALSTLPSCRDKFRLAIGDHAGEVPDTVDVIFPVLHGPHGEGGTIQGLFESSGIVYTGPGVLASAAGMDKECTRNLLQATDLSIGKQTVLHIGEPLSDEDKEILGLPVLVKPARGESSIDISRVDDRANLDVVVELAREHGWKVVIEVSVDGAEAGIGVLQCADGSLQVLVPSLLCGIEDSDEGFYGSETKHLDDVVSAQIPAELPKDILKALDTDVRWAFKALGSDGSTRVGLFVTDNGPITNEANIMPGSTPISTYPQMLAASGVAYEELLSALTERTLVARR